MFYNCREAIPLRITLEEMGHPQPPTNITVYNSMVHGLTQGTMIPKKPKSMDMRFHCIKCREAQGHLRYLWRSWKNNRAKYHTKHHPPQHHRDMLTEYLAQYSVNKRKWHSGINNIIRLLHSTLR